MPEKTKNGLLWSIGLVLILLGVIYFAFSDGVVGTVRVGVITPIVEESEIELQQAYQLAVQQVNESKGRNVELFFEDGTCESADVVGAAQKLIGTYKVEFILSSTCEDETLAISEVTQNARVLHISSSLAGAGVGAAGDLVYRTYPSADTEAVAIAAHADQLRAAVISEDTSFSQDARNAFVDSYQGEVVFDQVYDNETTAFWMLMRDIRNANPQMIYVIPSSADSGLLLLGQIERAYLNVAVYGAQSLVDLEMFEANQSLYEELVLAELRLKSEGAGAEFLAAFEAQFENTPSDALASAAAFDAVKLIEEAVNAGAYEAEGVAEFLDSTVNDWPGAIGNIRFDENGDAQVDLTLVQVIGGVLVEATE